MYSPMHKLKTYYIKDCNFIIRYRRAERNAWLFLFDLNIRYEYMENVFVGNKFFVSKVMKLYEVDTWRKLSEMADVVKEKKNEICNYLRELETEIGHGDYGECVKFVNKL